MKILGQVTLFILTVLSFTVAAIMVFGELTTPDNLMFIAIKSVGLIFGMISYQFYLMLFRERA